jgi:hypothetical protein
MPTGEPTGGLTSLAIETQWSAHVADRVVSVQAIAACPHANEPGSAGQRPDRDDRRPHESAPSWSIVAASSTFATST